jgi:hypothetical protein
MLSLGTSCSDEQHEDTWRTPELLLPLGSVILHDTPGPWDGVSTYLHMVGAGQQP